MSVSDIFIQVLYLFCFVIGNLLLVFLSCDQLSYFFCTTNVENTQNTHTHSTSNWHNFTHFLTFFTLFSRYFQVTVKKRVKKTLRWNERKMREIIIDSEVSLYCVIVYFIVFVMCLTVCVMKLRSTCLFVNSKQNSYFSCC